VWAYDAVHGRIAVLYDDDAGRHGRAGGGLNRPGDVFVAEDGHVMEVNVITREGLAEPFLRVEGHDGSRITGLAFSPDGSRLYFSSQRGGAGSAGDGVTYEITGPFRA
jgi:hypothetical protein